MRMDETTYEVKYVKKITSDDGKLTVWTRINEKDSSEERTRKMDDAREKVRQYEESAEGVIWARLRQSGVMLYLDKENEKHRELIIRASDMFNGGNEGDEDYWLFSPRSEDDCKDFCVYARMRGCEVFTWERLSEKQERYYRESLVTDRPEPGVTYLVEDFDGGSWYRIFPLTGKNTVAVRMRRFENDLMAVVLGAGGQDEGGD